MCLPERLHAAVWLAIVVLIVAVASYALDQSQDITLALLTACVCLLAVDWFIAPRKGE